MMRIYQTVANMSVQHLIQLALHQDQFIYLLEVTQRFVHMYLEHYVKSVRIRSFSGPYFPAFGLNTDQKNAEYGNFSRSGM